VKAFGSVAATSLRRTPFASRSARLLFYATDDAEGATEVERLIRIAGSIRCLPAGFAKAGRIEVGGDLHPMAD